MKWFEIHGGTRSLTNKRNYDKKCNLDKYNTQTRLSKYTKYNVTLHLLVALAPFIVNTDSSTISWHHLALVGWLHYWVKRHSLQSKLLNQLPTYSLPNLIFTKWLHDNWVEEHKLPSSCSRFFGNSSTWLWHHFTFAKWLHYWV